MPTKRPSTESKKLEQARIALTNAEANQEIKSTLADYGMNSEKIAQGKLVYENTLSLFEQNEKETAESRIASNDYKIVFQEVESLFKRHRDHTILFFKKQPQVLIALGVGGRFPYTYTDFFNKVKQFYGGIKSDPAIQEQMSKIKITPDVVEHCLDKYNLLLEKRAIFDKEMGEAQAVTKTKGAAFAQLEDWMDDFEAIARIAFYDSPQMLEVIGFHVPS